MEMILSGQASIHFAIGYKSDDMMYLSTYSRMSKEVYSVHVHDGGKVGCWNMCGTSPPFPIQFV
jgi:hypothetical protein